MLATSDSNNGDGESGPARKIVCVRLARVLDSDAAAALANELLEARGQPLRIEAGEVRALGALCLQALLSARQTWEADGHSFSLGEASDDFAHQSALLGAPLLECASAGRHD